MSLNLMKLKATEAERITHSEGLIMFAELFARIVDLEAERDALVEELEKVRDDAADDSLTQWVNKNGDADAYKEFFYNCFDFLGGYYPAPSVTSDYDKSVIFNAIERGEGVTE